MDVFMLKHVRKVDNECTDTKWIGFFSSKEKCRDVIKCLKKLEGFCDYPDDFIVEKREISGKITSNKIYHLTHYHDLEDEVFELSDIGVFSSMLAATRARNEWLRENKKKKNLKGFSIDEYRLDEVSRTWEEGFFTVE